MTFTGVPDLSGARGTDDKIRLLVNYIIKMQEEIEIQQTRTQKQISALSDVIVALDRQIAGLKGE